MKKFLYFYRDILAGSYEHFGDFVNDDVAKRAFVKACEDPAVAAEDLELYRVGRYDTYDCTIDDCEVSVLIARGKKNVSE